MGCTSGLGVVNCFSTRLSFEKNSSDISRFLFCIVDLLFHLICGFLWLRSKIFYAFKCLQRVINCSRRKVIIVNVCVFFNSRTAIAGAIIGLLLVFFISSSWFLLRPYDATATFCSFVHAISTELHVWRHFSLLMERVFLFMRVIKFLVTLDLPYSQKRLPHFEIDFYLL